MSEAPDITPPYRAPSVPPQPTIPNPVEKDIVVQRQTVFNINKFRSELRSGGIQHTNRYGVGFVLPEALTGSAKLLQLRCMNVVVPGKILMTKDDVLRYGRGPIDTVAYGTQYTPVSMGMILDDKGEVLDLMQRWMLLINNADSVDDTPDNSYEVEYRDNYVTSVEIRQYNVKQAITTAYFLNKAFPLSLGDIATGWDQNNQAAILPVTFAYRDYQTRKQ
jgi:hypothetical protein